MINAYDTKKVLFVNSDRNYINRIKLNLLDHFELAFAYTGGEALDIIEGEDAFAVIVADINLPVFESKDFISYISEIMPDTVRIILSDFSDINVLIETINKNNIYCFIKKDTPVENLIEVIDGAIKTYHLSILEKKINMKLRSEIKERQALEDELRKSNEELKKFAFEDELTGLANRRFTQDMAMRELDRTKRYGESLSFLMIDLDNFKVINDNYGHLVGDKVLSDFASILKRNLRLTDIAGRIGGEEFLIVLPETSIDFAKVVAEKLRNQVEFANICGLNITCSIGVSEIYLKNDKYEDILGRADEALYRAKARGRNRVEVLSEVNI